MGKAEILGIPDRGGKRRRAPRFELIAGNVCLDFVNTLDDRHTAHPKELLGSYVDLARFGEDAGLLEPSQVDSLFARSEQSPEAAKETLRWARNLREAIHDVFWAIINKQAVPRAALGRLNADVQSAAEHLRLVPDNGGLVWRFDHLSTFDGILWPIARAAADLLASEQVQYVRACSSKACEWFFLDTSKNHQRRWCDMTTCGNRAKARSFYARQKKS
jgi:predicted RNA-binding Zn ribbon-like protein